MSDLKHFTPNRLKYSLILKLALLRIYKISLHRIAYLHALAVASAAVVDVATGMIATHEGNGLHIRIVAEEVHSW